jgi:hypothetical protein
MKIVLNADGSRSGDKEMEQLFAEILKEMFETFCKKQKSYGRGNISQFGERGVLIRSSDKLERLKRLVWNGVENPLSNENIEDTWVDLAVYSAIALLCRRGKWI